MGNDDVFDLANRLFKAIEGGDMATVGELYSPEVRVWHNFNQEEQDRDGIIRALSGAHAAGVRFEEVRREVLPDGFLQQHVIRVATPDGHDAEVPAAMRFYLRDGRVVRVEEYVDTAQAAALRARR